jgi:hypothetical protein
MKTTILKAIGASLMVVSCSHMAAAAEHHVRRERAPSAQLEQFRNSNASYSAPNYFAERPYGDVKGQDEAAMSSGIAGH